MPSRGYSRFRQHHAPGGGGLLYSTSGAALMLLVLLVALALQATSLTCTVIMRYTTGHGDAEVERIGMVD